MEKNSFFKNHADAIAVVGVNIAIGAILISMWMFNTNRIDATNARMDQVYNVILNMMKKEE